MINHFYSLLLFLCDDDWPVAIVDHGILGGHSKTVTDMNAHEDNLAQSHAHLLFFFRRIQILIFQRSHLLLGWWIILNLLLLEMHDAFVKFACFRDEKDLEEFEETLLLSLQMYQLAYVGIHAIATSIIDIKISYKF